MVEVILHFENVIYHLRLLKNFFQSKQLLVLVELNRLEQISSFVGNELSEFESDWPKRLLFFLVKFIKEFKVIIFLFSQEFRQTLSLR